VREVQKATGRQKRLRGDMQVRTVRMEESHRPLTTALLASHIHEVLSSGSTVQMASTPHDPFMRTVHSPPESNQ